MLLSHIAPFGKATQMEQTVKWEENPQAEAQMSQMSNEIPLCHVLSEVCTSEIIST